MASGDLLYLFSSNIRPLYVQDILDVLAAPRGARYHFRYDEKYVEETLLHASAAGSEALLHFSIQQEARYHDPAFVPVRRARVVESSVRAGIFVVSFELTDYVALNLDDGLEDTERLAAAVREYTRRVREGRIGNPADRISASLGEDLRNATTPVLDTSASETDCFRRTTEALQRTEWFRGARFVRFLRVREGATGAKDIAIADGRYSLQAGSTYAFELTHYQPADVTDTQEFNVSADEDVMTIIGSPAFSVSSRYDYIRVFVHATLPPREQPRETVLAIGPTGHVQGPTIRLPVQVKPPAGRTAALAATSAVTLTLLGLPAVFTGMAQGVKLLLVIAAALIAAALQSYGWSIFVPSGLGVTGRETRSATDHAA